MLNLMFHTLLMFTGAVILSASAAEPACLTGNDTVCLEKVRSLLVSQSAFWFGTSAINNLSKHEADIIDTVLPSRNITRSIMGRLTSEELFDPNALTSVAKMTFSPNPTTYSACGLTVTISQTSAKTFTIDPLDDTVHTPFFVKDKPDLSWLAQDGEIYTVVFYDVGLVFFHSLWSNIKGGRLSDGQVVVPYNGPGNPFTIENLYAFAVFKQAGEVDIDSIRQYARKNGRNFRLTTEAFNLTGPVSVNFFRVPGDEYAAGKVRSFMNFCPHYVGKDFSRYIRDNGQISFLPANLFLTVSLGILYNASAITYTSCCKEYKAEARIFRRDDIAAPQNSNAVFVRDRPSVIILPAGNVSYASQTLTGKRHTLLFVDANSAVVDKSHDVLVHWMVINIPAGDVAAGNEAITYSSPHPEVIGGLYLFLLYEQKSDYPQNETQKYAGKDCVSAEKGRCKYRIGDFIDNKGLNLVGLRTMTINSDEYSRDLLYTTRLKTQKEACKSVTEDLKSCLPSTGNKMAVARLCLALGLLLALVL